MDNLFAPVLLQQPLTEAFETAPTAHLDVYSVPSILVHTKMNVKHYSYFRTESRPATAPAVDIVNNNINNSIVNAQRGSVILSAPVLPARVPPNYIAPLENDDSSSQNDNDTQSFTTKASTQSEFSLVALSVSAFTAKPTNRKVTTPANLTGATNTDDYTGDGVFC